VKIALYNLEPKYKNLALEKLRKFYSNYEVEDYFPLRHNSYDIIYCSSIFDYTNKENLPPNIIKGGTGFDLTIKLPEYIEQVNPHLNFGFTSRGCIRKCKFCLVPEKEGYIRATNDLLDLWDKKAKIVTLFDNNILALPTHFEKICKQARENKLRLDFNQGLDHRLLTPEIVNLLTSISHHEYRFAFDNIKSANTVIRAIELLQSKGINRCLWYVLVGFDSTFKKDLERINFLREHNQIAYVMRYKNGTKNAKDDKLIALARWVNQPHIFRGMTWLQFINHPGNKTYYKLFDTLEKEETVLIKGKNIVLQ